MEPAGSLPHSQVPATCPYPEPDRSNPCSQIPLPEVPFLYYPSVLCVCVYIYIYIYNVHMRKKQLCHYHKINILITQCTL